MLKIQSLLWLLYQTQGLTLIQATISLSINPIIEEEVKAIIVEDTDHLRPKPRLKQATET